MLIAILLSGEHPSLPYSEVNAILKGEEISFSEVNRFDQLMIIDGGKEVFDVLKRRGAYIVEGGRLITHIPNISDLINQCDKIDWSFIEGKSFGVRVKRVKNYWKEFSSVEIEKKLGGIIKRHTNSKVNLENPEIWIRGIITNGGIFIYECNFRISKKEFIERRPRKRVFFHPGALDAKLSRVFVNLCRIKRGEKFLDPFCGTGGFLIEAELMGLDAYGLDIDLEMVKGAYKNLKYYGLEANLILADARKLPINKVDGISTDPPYGRGTSTKGRSVKEIISNFLEEVKEVLRKNRFMCIASPQEVKIEEEAIKKGYKVHEVHIMKVHKSLTRSIIVVENL
ncbi:MAG: TIGR01177 family methyltransferase [Candidatus Verstraetearchaeota archaeon]|nr:TIGR01177 family methyltransferase [Candidatus Verstraetearchaeota archaeon]